MDMDVPLQILRPSMQDQAERRCTACACHPFGVGSKLRQRFAGMVSVASLDSMLSAAALAMLVSVVMENSLWSLKGWRAARLFQAGQLAR